MQVSLEFIVIVVLESYWSFDNDILSLSNLDCVIFDIVLICLPVEQVPNFIIQAVDLGRQDELCCFFHRRLAASFLISPVFSAPGKIGVKFHAMTLLVLFLLQCIDFFPRIDPAIICHLETCVDLHS